MIGMNLDGGLDCIGAKHRNFNRKTEIGVSEIDRSSIMISKFDF